MKSALVTLVEVIRARFGLDFGGARQPVLVEALARLDPDLESAAAGVLRADHQGLAELAGTLTNSETYFFRHAEQFTALATLLHQQWSQRPPVLFRAWSAGCASGEEALSISAVVEDVGALVPVRPVASILATDLSPAALSNAQRARYSEWSFRGVLPEQRARAFVRDGSAWVPKPALKERITFQRHNLLDPPPEPLPFDLVVCRNVLIYFDAPRTAQALNSLALAVAPGGLLVLGPVESSAARLPDFDMLHSGASIIYRKRGYEAAQAVPPRWSLLPQAGPVVPSAPRPSAPLAPVRPPSALSTSKGAIGPEGGLRRAHRSGENSDQEPVSPSGLVGTTNSAPFSPSEVEDRPPTARSSIELGPATPLGLNGFAIPLNPRGAEDPLRSRSDSLEPLALDSAGAQRSRVAPASSPAPVRAPRSFADRLAEATALADGGRLADARAAAEALRREFGDVGELRILFALICLEQGDEAQAAAELEEAVARRADLPMAHYLLGSILDEQGARAEAQERYRQALGTLGELSPHAQVVGGGGLTTADLVDTLTHALGLSPEVRR